MRILGIDLGKTSVKAVEIDSAFGRFDVHEYHEQKIAPGQNPLEAVQTLLHSLPKPPDRVAVALRTGQTTFRNLQLPTKDRKAIQASVGFELDDDLPFSIDDAAYDYSNVSQGSQGTQVHVVATLKKHLVAALEQWRAAGADPDLVTSEAWAYRTLLNRVLSPEAQQNPVLLVHAGHDRTLIYVHWRGLPVVARELAWGGRDLTMAICRRYDVPLDQAEAAKLDNGFILPPSQREAATQEQKDFSDALLEPIAELIREMRQAELTCKNVTHQQVSRVFLSGGTSLLPGLGRLIEEELSVPATPLHALTSVSGGGVTYAEATDATFSLPVALGLCLVGSDRSSALNLRKGEFSKEGGEGFNIKALKAPLIAAGIVAFSLFLSLVIQNSVYQSRLKETDAQLEKSVRAFFGQVSSSTVRTYMASTGTLRKELEKELNKHRELSKLLGPNPASPLAFLRELSASIPRDVVVDMTQYQVGAAADQPYKQGDEGNASLTFLVSNPQIAEKLAEQVGRKLSNVQRGKMEEVEVPGPEGSSIKKWKVAFSGKPTEDSYGK